MPVVDNRKMTKIIRSQNRLYRSPEIKGSGKKRSRVFETIPIPTDEIKQGYGNIRNQRWMMRLFELKRFKQKHGHCEVTHDQYKRNKNYIPLARWCQYQRTLKRIHHLRPDRFHKLEKAGFSWDPFDRRWEVHFAKLKKYKQKFGHCHVTGTQDISLYRWAESQRLLYRIKSSMLTSEKIKKLNSVGFIWNNPWFTQPYISDEELLNDLKRVHKELKKVPNERDITKYGKYSNKTYSLRFGSTMNARERAGITSNESETRGDYLIKKVIDATGIPRDVLVKTQF